MQHWVRSILTEALSAKEDVSQRLTEDLSRVIAAVEGLDTHLFRQPKLDEVCDLISDSTDVEALSGYLLHAARLCGFQHASIFLLRQGGAAGYRTRVCTSFPMDWLERYGRRSYQFVDPVIARAATDDGPFQFSDLAADTPIANSFWEDAARHGVGRQGIGVAFDMPDGARIGVSFTTTAEGEEFRESLQLNEYDVLCVARLGADAFAYLARITPESADCLSALELRFLHFVVTSDSPERQIEAMPEFGSTMDLRTSICRKLGVGTILQAVAIATANRWFDDLPYAMSDVSRAFPDLASMPKMLRDTG